MKDTVKIIGNLIDHAAVSLISSIDEEGFPNTKACVYFFDPRFFRGVMLKGTMQIRQDQKTKKAIWRTGDKKYYVLGVTDPDYCVLEFTAQTSRYYCNFKSNDFRVE